MSDRLEFFFDPICPFCWVTSRWVVEVARQRPMEVTWRPLSLAILNEEISYEERKKASPEYPDSHVRGLEMLRVVHAAREAHGPEVVGDLYTALGELVWDADPPEGDDFKAVMHEMARQRDLRPALERVGLPTDLADAAHDTSRDDDLRAETQEAVDRCGGGVGTPILCFSSSGRPGPLRSRDRRSAARRGRPAPVGRGADAGRVGRFRRAQAHRALVPRHPDVLEARPDGDDGAVGQPGGHADVRCQESPHDHGRRARTIQVAASYRTPPGPWCATRSARRAARASSRIGGSRSASSPAC